MLSILIPIYRQDARELVASLHQQALDVHCPVEIVCIDDGSPESYRRVNRDLCALPLVRYEELSHNLGRAAIRNRLAKVAHYPFLLFIDADAGVLRRDFLPRYVQAMRPGRVLVGGTAYDQHPPKDRSRYLRWHYGRRREARPLKQRVSYPWAHFSTFQFVIPKDIQARFPFDEHLIGYGHEDTLFGLQLEQAGVEVVHIDNPLEHLGIDTAKAFLEKTDQGVDNLLRLVQRGVPIDTRLTRLARRMPSWVLFLANSLGGRYLGRVLRYLLETMPFPLWGLDLYKLLRYLNQANPATIARISSKESTMKSG